MDPQRGISPPFPSFAYFQSLRMELNEPLLGNTQTSLLSPPLPPVFSKSRSPSPEPCFHGMFGSEDPEDYQLLEKVGLGGYGIVHRARNIATGRVCAVKVVPLSKKKLPKLLNESLIQSRMSHKNVALVLGTYCTGPHLHIVQQYYSGGTLRDKIKLAPHCRIEPSAAAWYISQIAHGLAYIHRMGVIHRDIKESNVFLLSNGIVKIGDFGIAVEQDPLGFNSGYGGTRGWMSPEMIQSLPYTKATDTWSFGVVIYRLLTGKRPFLAFDGSTMSERVIAGAYPSSRHLEGLAGDLVSEFLRKDPMWRVDLNYVDDIPWIQHNICIAGRRKRQRAILNKKVMN